MRSNSWKRARISDTTKWPYSEQWWVKLILSLLGYILIYKEFVSSSLHSDSYINGNETSHRNPAQIIYTTEGILGKLDEDFYSIPRYDFIISQRSTPVLPYVRDYLNGRENHNFNKPYGRIHEKRRRSISPHKIPQITDQLNSDEFLSPLYEIGSGHIGGYRQERQAQLVGVSGDQPVESGTNLLDLVESGSGGGWDQSSEEASMNNENAIIPSRVLNSPMLTPRFEDGSVPDTNSDNQAPLLLRRLPVLTATSGQMWHYTIPADTFEDEDGSMRKLKVSLKFKSSYDESNDALEVTDKMEKPFDQYLHWLQYDQQTQTLVGYPTNDDIGKHDYDLIVSDERGQTSNLTIQVVVRRHPSIRAFSHTFKLVDIDWDSRKYTSLTKALIDIVKRITENLYSDPMAKSIVIHSYHFLNRSPSSGPMNFSPMTITWSNSSIPVYPCKTEQLDIILKALVEVRTNQTSDDNSTISFSPSFNLRRALEPDFRPAKVDFTLQGSCRNELFRNDVEYTDPNSGQEPKIRARIQRLQWRLGQPFAFRIPDNTFVIDRELTREDNLTLSIHTIDGIPLEDDPNYNYMEFDHDSRTLFGLPYDMNLHSGQRELLLTARNINPEHKAARDVIIIDIINPELTVLNNRAFNMSLYFISRVNSFTPRLRYELSRKIVQSLGTREFDSSSDPSRTEFVAIEMKKFQIDAQMSSYVDLTNSWAYHDKIRRVSDTFDVDHREPQTTKDNSALFKFTWTNESIGHLGDCPVEVITENVVGALERNMFDYSLPDDYRFDDPTKNDSARFYDRLRAFFEPDIDLIFLSIGPMKDSACSNSLGYYDVGNSDLADLVNMIDFSSNRVIVDEYHDAPSSTPKSREESKTARQMINSDEYWSIVVLIILVVVLIFVVMMFFMGMHTYRINQEKRFELQVKLAQARQNSMYLSSMMLADHVPRHNVVTQFSNHNGLGEPFSIEDGSSRKPVILENEKQLWANGHTDMTMMRPTAVQLNGHTVQTTPLRPNMTFTLDSISNMQNNMRLQSFNTGSEIAFPNQTLGEEKRRTMTLNRRITSENQPSNMMARQNSMNQLNHSQSILTVASLTGPVQFIPQQGLSNIPVVYAPLPVVCESNEMPSKETSA